VAWLPAGEDEAASGVTAGDDAGWRVAGEDEVGGCVTAGYGAGWRTLAAAG
jgi:hypothetical protein